MWWLYHRKGPLKVEISSSHVGSIYSLTLAKTTLETTQVFALAKVYNSSIVLKDITTSSEFNRYDETICMVLSCLEIGSKQAVEEGHKLGSSWEKEQEQRAPNERVKGWDWCSNTKVLDVRKSVVWWGGGEGQWWLAILECYKLVYIHIISTPTPTFWRTLVVMARRRNEDWRLFYTFYTIRVRGGVM